MKIHSVLLVLTLLLAGCAGDAARNYAGSPGSAYDRARNPPTANGTVYYDPQSPVLPYDYGRSGEGAATAAK